jgi:prepilin peptidase CpaA
MSIVRLLFAAFMAASAVSDILSYRIPNALVLALIGLFLTVAAFHGSSVDWLSHLGAAGLCLAVGVALYSFGQMGAGDAKLLTAAALWAGIVPLVPLLFWISVTGLAGMLIILILRRLLFRFQTAGRAWPAVLTPGKGVPYGVGIGLGSILASPTFPAWLWQF